MAGRLPRCATAPHCRRVPHRQQRTGSGDAGLLGYVRASLAWVDGDLDLIEDAIAEALDHARRRSPNERVMAAAMAGSVAWHREAYAEAIERYRECANVAGQHGDSWTRAFARRREVLMLALTGRQEEAAAAAAALAAATTDRMSAGLVHAAGVADLPTLLVGAATLARVSAEIGRQGWAALMSGWVDGVTTPSGLPLAPAERRHLADVVSMLDRAGSDDERAELSVTAQRGAAMPIDELARALARWPVGPEPSTDRGQPSTSSK